MKTLKYLVLFLVVAFTIVFLIPQVLASFLTVNRPLQSKTLLVEAWLPPHVFENFCDTVNDHNLERIILSGVNKRPFDASYVYRSNSNYSTSRHVVLLTNSILAVPVPNLVEELNSVSVFVSNAGSREKDAHFNVLLDNIRLGSGFARDTITEFLFTGRLNTNPESHLLIFFDNDKYTLQGDRNLRIHALKFNSDSIPLFIDYVKSSDLEFSFSEHPVLKSAAYVSRQYMQDLGIDADLFTVTMGEVKKRNMTLAAARGLKKEISGFMDSGSFNMLSLGIHSRRSWLTYRRTLGPDYRIGVFAARRIPEVNRKWWIGKYNPVEVYEEFLAYLYVKFQPWMK